MSLLNVEFPFFIRPAERVVTEKRNIPSLYDRLNDQDSGAFADCIKRNGDLVWHLSQQYTHSPEEAGRATAEIFNEIWKYAASKRASELNECETVSYIAHRYLLGRK